MAAFQTTIAGVNLEIHAMANDNFIMSWGGAIEKLDADRIEEAKLSAIRIVSQKLQEGLKSLKNLEFKTLYGGLGERQRSSVALA